MADNDIDHGENTDVYGRQSVYSGGGRHRHEWPPSDQTHRECITTWETTIGVPAD
jgi:hypothetical protein